LANIGGRDQNQWSASAAAGPGRMAMIAHALRQAIGGQGGV